MAKHNDTTGVDMNQAASIYVMFAMSAYAMAMRKSIKKKRKHGGSTTGKAPNIEIVGHANRFSFASPHLSHCREDEQ